MADEEEEEEGGGETEQYDEEDDVGEQTMFRNLYATSILPPFDDEAPDESMGTRKYRSRKDYTILLDDSNADDYGDLTHVGWKGRVDYAVREMEEEKQRSLANKDDVYRDPNHLLEVTISTIILMASGSPTVPMENYLYTELYLKNIKDENGDHPPNISKLLKHMRHLKKQYDIKWEEEYKAEPPPNLVLTKICKKSKIPVKINRTLYQPSRASATPAPATEEGEGEGDE